MKKKCTDCKQYKTLDAYYNDKRSSDGKGSMCKECFNRRRAENYRFHKEKGGIRYWNDRARSITARVKHKFGCEGVITGRHLLVAYLKQKRRCKYCGAKLRHDETFVDHVNPVSRGGENIPQNIVISCRTCNLMKNDLTLDEFMDHIRKVLNCFGEHRGNSVG